ncbi:hypothetical protein [Oligoflexus tunisiensis]|uniref:hypothetical protein n=1 Tax=Oligoflexus tunisiensis TaxID=708132 RepID=UPI001C404EBE|nr:hypothetical protein [Oligoflexus tunisiensis]
MNLRRILPALALMASLLSAASAYSRGGETGTLLIVPGSRSTPHRRVPYYLSLDHFRRLRARLSHQPLAPIPGWESQRAWRFHERYFTEDGVHEILPRVKRSSR